MKRVALTIISIVLLGTISSFAQDSIQPIVVKKAFLGNKYFYGDTRILSISDWANSHLKKGVALYNDHLGTVSYNPIKVDLEIEPCGIGITMSF